MLFLCFFWSEFLLEFLLESYICIIIFIKILFTTVPNIVYDYLFVEFFISFASLHTYCYIPVYIYNCIYASQSFSVSDNSGFPLHRLHDTRRLLLLTLHWFLFVTICLVEYGLHSSCNMILLLSILDIEEIILSKLWGSHSTIPLMLLKSSVVPCHLNAEVLRVFYFLIYILNIFSVLPVWGFSSFVGLNLIVFLVRKFWVVSLILFLYCSMYLLVGCWTSQFKVTFLIGLLSVIWLFWTFRLLFGSFIWLYFNFQELVLIF